LQPSSPIALAQQLHHGFLGCLVSFFERTDRCESLLLPLRKAATIEVLLTMLFSVVVWSILQWER